MLLRRYIYIYIFIFVRLCFCSCCVIWDLEGLAILLMLKEAKLFFFFFWVSKVLVRYISLSLIFNLLVMKLIKKRVKLWIWSHPSFLSLLSPTCFLSSNSLQEKVVDECVRRREYSTT